MINLKDLKQVAESAEGVDPYLQVTKSTILSLIQAHETMKEALGYISMPHNEFKGKLHGDTVEEMSEAANQRLFDISEAKKALSTVETILGSKE